MKEKQDTDRVIRSYIRQHRAEYSRKVITQEPVGAVYGDGQEKGRVL